MEKEPKLAPLISFNHHFKNHDSDEELLVVDTPLKKLEIKEPHESMSEQVNIQTEAKSFKSSNALIIGEMEINYNEICQENKRIISNDLSVSCSNNGNSILRAPIIPYIIMPLSNNTKNVKIKETLCEQTQNDNRNSYTNNIQIDGKLDNAENAEKQSETSTYISIQREKWSHKTEFLLAIIGFSVDLGNIWRFPKVVYENGGGRFLIPYFVQLAFCGLPLFFMELALGQSHQTGLYTLMEKICPLLKGLALTSFVIDLFMAMFYNTIIAWAVYYLVLSFRSVVPWKGCSESWNTLCCLPINNYNNMQANNFSLYDTNYQMSSSGSYISKIYPEISESISRRIVIFDNRKNVKNLERVGNKAVFEISKFINEEVSFSNHFKKIQEIANETLEARVENWVNSYFVLVNKTIHPAPKVDLPSENINKYFFDPLLLTNLIEEKISEVYLNQSVSVFLSCEKNFNNPTQEFYTRYLTEMHKSTGLEELGNIKWEMLLSLLIVFITVYFALWKGIKSAGKAVWITAIAPYIVMIILLIRGITLDGSWMGIKFYLSVDDWGSLFEMKVWVDAATQIFFSLGPGFGTIIALSSYNKKTNDCYKDALLTSFINCFTSILSGFVVFSTLGHMAHVQGKTIQEVTEPGPGLIFITYPQAISLMPWAPFWAVIFFFMLFTLGIDSTFGGLESVITGVCDTYPQLTGKKRSWFVLGLIGLCFFAAIPTVTYGGPYIVNLFDNFAVAPAILIVVFLEIIGVMYAYGCDRFCDDLKEMIKRTPNDFWIYCWKYISPAIVVIMTFMICKGMISAPLEYGNGYVYEGKGEFFASLIVGIPISLIFIYAAYRIYKTEGTLEERVKKLMKPKDAWHKNTQPIQADNTIKMENLEKNPKYIIVNFNQTVTDSVNL
ncbi:unnamed protein product [Brachionus calyciflorus]|uniref:Uncharacterized protein n=1 Tax=Brachionus calyciflorus TaxID=104777 RepID=A0A813PBG6_9BILA|nr:unnamed protein product [Brachionus calyciflorus]